MKKYIFITTHFGNLGGAQLYLSAKKEWLEKNGWVTDIICCKKENVIISNLKTCNGVFPEIAYPTYYYRRKVCKSVLDRIYERIYDAQCAEYIIESCVINQSTWGELLAERLQCKHIVFTLQENDSVPNRSMLEYLKFKHNRKELVGIDPSSLVTMFKNEGYDIDVEKSYSLVARAANPVSDYAHKMVDEIKSLRVDFVIGSVGRLEKPFVSYNLRKLAEYIKAKPEKRFAMVFIGGTSVPDAKAEIEDICKGIANLSLFITGFIYPIPIDLLRLCDFCFATSGSVKPSWRAGIPTIAIDASDKEPIGVYGFDTYNDVYRTDEPARSIVEYIDEIILGSRYPKTKGEEIVEPTYEEHIEFINDSCPSLLYYDMNLLGWNKSQQMQKFGMLILGPTRFMKLYRLLKKKNEKNI